jgi:hypothetical protein
MTGTVPFSSIARSRPFTVITGLPIRSLIAVSLAAAEGWVTGASATDASPAVFPVAALIAAIPMADKSRTHISKTSMVFLFFLMANSFLFAFLKE